jgi:hypothetical protein
MGFNLMSSGRRLEVMEQARRSMATELRAIRARGAPLPDRGRPPSRRTPRPRASSPTARPARAPRRRAA